MPIAMEDKRASLVRRWSVTCARRSEQARKNWRWPHERNTCGGTCAQFLERQSDGVNVLWEPHRTAVTAEWDAVALTAGVLKDQDRRTDWDVDEVAALPFFAVRSFGDGHGLRSCQIWGEGRPCPRWKHLRRQPQAAIMKRGRDALSGPYCCQKSLKCLSHAA
eukprot:1801540-Rhodomonas_salina.3